MKTRAESKNLILFCTIQCCLRIQNNKFNKLFILEIKNEFARKNLSDRFTLYNT